MKCHCGGSLQVIDTRKVREGIRRFRRCRVCGRKYLTLETVIEKAASLETPAPMAAPAPQQTTKQRRVEVRRKLEDRVSRYYIEDDEF